MSISMLYFAYSQKIWTCTKASSFEHILPVLQTCQLEEFSKKNIFNYLPNMHLRHHLIIVIMSHCVPQYGQIPNFNFFVCRFSKDFIHLFFFSKNNQHNKPKYPAASTALSQFSRPPKNHRKKPNWSMCLF